MSLTAEESAALAADEPSADDTNETPLEETPASGEQPTEQLEEGAAPAAEDEAGTQPPDGEKPEAEKPAEKPANWRAVEAAKKAQIKVARDREALSRDAERVTQYEQRVKTHLEQRTADLDAREAKVKPVLEAIKRKDLAALSGFGFDFQSFAREALEANTPEGRAKRAEERVNSIEKRDREREEKRQQESEQQALVAANRRDASQLSKMVDEDADVCPELFAWAPERVAQEGIFIRDAIRQHGGTPTYAKVLAELQARARNEAAIAAQRKSGRQQQSRPSSSEAGSAGKADPHRTSVGGNPPALSSQTANLRPPTPPREKTEEEIDEECRQMLREGLKPR